MMPDKESPGQPPPEPQGLTEEQARQRLAAEGPNALPGRGRRPVLRLVLDVLREPMLALLLAAGLVYLLLGDRLEAAMLLGFACFSVFVTIAQEGRADRAIEALGELARPQARVIRGGVRRDVPAAEVVRGDLLLIGEGERIAADGWLVAAADLSIDEAVLTGESVPVGKSTVAGEDRVATPLPGGENLPYAFSGTLVVRGHGTISVAATGARTSIGAIGKALASIDTEAPRLARETQRLVRFAAAFAVVTSMAAAVLFALLRGGWLDAALSGISLSMSLLPEELPVVLTLFLTAGALRMSRKRVLARRGAAIEALGATTVLCTDKTGTLTQNRMEVAELRLPDGQRFVSQPSAPVPEAFGELAELGALASLDQPVDPMEAAFHELAARGRSDGRPGILADGLTRQRHYPLAADLLAVSHVWEGAGEDRVVAAKGAPEAIAELCAMTAGERAAMDREAAEMASRGLRVLGIAEARWSAGDLPPSQRHFDYAFRGLAGLADPIRGSVPQAVAELQGAGIRIAMITGDYPLTAQAIARQAGIGEGEVMTGAQLAALDDDALRRRIGGVSVFARVMADQKLRIVEALQAGGEVVAMIGDGVNDAPSLKAAHIGVAMGRKGTEVAREAAAIVLLDDEFAAIPEAVRLGRRIYDNLRKATGFIFAVHVPIAALALAPLLFGWPLILAPMHIASLEMVIDPICALAFEAEREERDIMRRPPRDADASLFPRALLLWSLGQGAIAAALVLALRGWTVAQPGLNADDVGGITFLGLVLSVLVLVVTNRSFASAALGRGMQRNLPLAGIVLAAGVFFTLVFAIEPASRAFGFGRLPPEGIVAIVAMVAALGATLTALKFALRRVLVA